MDLIGLLFSLEMLTITTYLFIAYPSEQVKNLKAAFKTLILTHISGLTLLIFTLIMWTATGTTLISALTGLIPAGSPLITAGAALILCTAMPKTDQIPFHTWLPDSTVTPTPSIIVYHSCGFQIGVYIILRFLFQVFREQLNSLPVIPFHSVLGNITVWGLTVTVIGALTLIIGAVYGMLENNYKKIIAYTAISETGLIIIAAGFTTTLAFTACIYYTISHALISTLLFLSYGSVEYATGETDINKIGNLYQYMPLTGISAVISVIAIGGMPLLSEFIGKYLLINAALNISALPHILLMFIGAALHIVIAIRILNSVFLTTTYNIRVKSQVKDPPREMTAVMLLIIAAIFTLGVAPNLFIEFIVKPAVLQAGLTFTLIESFDLLITGSGYLTYITIAVSALSILGMVSYIILVGGGRKRKMRSLEAEKPFIGGEDITVVKSTYTEQFYYYLLDLLKIRRAASLLDVDKFFDKIAGGFRKICERLSKLDVGSYLKALLMFLAGSLIVAVIALII